MKELLICFKRIGIPISFSFKAKLNKFGTMPNWVAATLFTI